jgi:acrylyl-CoA reductase (NADPH)
MRALLLRRSGDGPPSAAVEELDDALLPPGEVTVAVSHSTLNYKDALILTGQGGLVRSYPHVPGVDFAGVVEASADPRLSPGDAVLLTGWRIGETRWGGLASRARVPAGTLLPLPPGLSAREAMAIGTAGLAAMLALLALEAQGLEPGRGPVLVTGAAGGVGSIATALLAAAGHEVACVTGRPEQEEYLRGLGAARVIARAELAQTVARPLESETWAGAIDNVAGAMLARLLGQMRHGAAVAAVGLAGGAEVPLRIIPFLLRGVSLIGIDTVLAPLDRRAAAWARLARDLDRDRLAAMTEEVGLDAVPALAPRLLAGGIRGRLVVDLGG